MAKILVTGGAGYIGSHVLELLRNSNFECVVIDDLSTGHKDSLLGAELYEGNINDSELIKKVFSDHPEIDSAIHFAGSIIVPESVENPVKYYENNFTNGMKFLETAIKCGLKNLIFSSTAAVYGEKSDGICVETDDPAPMNPYGYSKLMFETLLKDLNHIKRINYIALRYFNVAGASSSGKLGQRSKQSTHLLKIASETAVGKREKMSIFGNDYPTPDGTCIRDYIHIEDLAAAHLDALKYLMNGGESQILNCGYGKGSSVVEVLDAFREAVGIDIIAEVADRRPGDAPKLMAKVDKIKQVLGWEPKFDDLALIARSAYEFEKKL
jgi:UDP-glucose 4-epimerase